MAKSTTTSVSGATKVDNRRLQAIQKVRELMTEHNLTLGDIRPPAHRTKRVKPSLGVVKPKAIYRNPATGEQWEGVGAAPKWLAEMEAEGQHREKFRIKTGWGRLPEDTKKRAATKAAKKTVKKVAKKK